MLLWVDIKVIENAYSIGHKVDRGASLVGEARLFINLL